MSTLINDIVSPGIYDVSFDASSAFGGLPSGIYLYKFESKNFMTTRKMMLLKLATSVGFYLNT